MVNIPGFVEVRAVTQWDGQEVTCRQIVHADLWNDTEARDSLKTHLRHALGGLIAQQLSVQWRTFTHDKPFDLGGRIED